MTTPISSTNTRQYLPGLLLLLISVIIGLNTYQDYGISWDEPVQREMGEVSYNYVFRNDQTLLTYGERDHGVGFELPLVMMEKVIDTPTSRDVYLMRHLVTHLFFLLCCFGGYVLVQHLFKNKLLSCLGFVMFVFHPRLYAHSFFNSKDIPFAGMFLVCFMLCEIAFRKDKRWLYILLGLSVGYATSIRILGIILVGPILLFFLFSFIAAIKNKGKASAVLLNTMLFLLSAFLALYTAFPTLWPSPIHNFIEVFKSMSHFRWINTVLFMGDQIWSDHLPFYYLPAWMGITTPIIWLLAGIIGLVLLVISLIKKPGIYIQNSIERNYILYAFCFLFPLVMIVSMHSIVYDDWRHVYFIYPAFVMLAMFSIHKIGAKYGQIVFLMVALQVLNIIHFMGQYHPHHQTYFNQLVSHKSESLRMNYELDYWGSSYKEGMEYILAHDTSAQVRIFESLSPVANAFTFLPEAQKKRVVFVNRNEFPYYFITNFRGHPDDYTPPEVTSVYYEIKVLNSTILRVYRCQ